MSLAFQDVNGLSLEALRLDELQPTYRIFRLKNTGSSKVENAKVRLEEVGHAVADASQLAQRAIAQMDYTRHSSGAPEQQFLGVGPISVMTEDPEELEAVLMTGWLQLSADTFRWGSLLEIGMLDTGEYVDLYGRYQKPTYVSEQTFQFSIRNIGTDTLESVVLTRQTSDTLSLDGLAFSNSISLGDLAPLTIKTVWIKTSSIAPRAVNGKIEALSGTVSSGSIRFDVAGGRAYCTIHQIRQYLQTIDVDVITTDEEVLDLIYRSANEMDRATRRRFDTVTVIELYDGVGQQKLVLDNYPIVSIQEVKIRNPDNQVVTDIKSTDANFASELIIDAQNGFITLPSAGIPMLASQLGALGWYPPIYAYQPFPAAGVPFDYTTHFGRGIANIEVTYSYGFAIPPSGIRDACMKMVVIELLKKKGASDTQGATTIGVAGMTETFATRGGASGGAGPFGHVIDELQQDIDATLELFRKRRWGVV
jgi:hypothetical protein